MANGSTAALGEAIDRHRQSIEKLWLDWLKRDLEVTHVPSTDLKDGIGDYLRLIAEALREGECYPGNVEKAWKSIADRHALTRVRLGFDVEQLLHELMLLRRAMIEVLRQDGIEMNAARVIELTEVIDMAMTTSVSSYVEARDYAAQRVQAEHLGFITHQLKGPLTAALLSAEALQRMGVPTAQHARALDRVLRNFRRARGLAEEVLQAASLDSGRTQFRPTETTLGEVIDEIVEDGRLAAQDKGCAFSAVYDGALGVCVDPELTRRAIESLLDNAIKYTDEGRVSILVEDSQAQISIHVRDSGPGLSPEEAPSIFEPFQRGNSGKTGTGLGLSIARRSVELQGGTLNVESEQRGQASEHGCHFWFTIPKGRGSGSAQASEAG